MLKLTNQMLHLVYSANQMLKLESDSEISKPMLKVANQIVKVANQILKSINHVQKLANQMLMLADQALNLVYSANQMKS